MMDCEDVLQRTYGDKHVNLLPTLDYVPNLPSNSPSHAAFSDGESVSGANDAASSVILRRPEKRRVASEGGFQFDVPRGFGRSEYETVQHIDRKAPEQDTVFEFAFPSSLSRPEIDPTQLFEKPSRRNASRRKAGLKQRYCAVVGSSNGRRIGHATADVPSTAACCIVRQRSKRHKRLRCPVSGCKSATGFRGHWELGRHLKSQHHLAPAFGDKRLFRCALLDCRRRQEIWPRSDKFRDHVRDDHPDVDLDSHFQASTINEDVRGNVYGKTFDTIKDGVVYQSNCSLPPGVQSHTPIRDAIDEFDSFCDVNIPRRQLEVPVEQLPALPSPIASSCSSTHKIFAYSLGDADLVNQNVSAGASPASPSDTEHQSRENEAQDLRSFPFPVTPDSQSHSIVPVKSNSIPRRTLIAGVVPSSVPVDGNEGNTSSQTYQSSTQTSHCPSMSSGHRHNLHPRKGKGKKRGQSPDPPSGSQKRSPSPSSEKGHELLCAFHNNPMPDRFELHRTTPWAHLSQLKNYHARHGLFYCGTCLTPFSSKDGLHTHGQSRCRDYRCVRGDCPNRGELFGRSKCPHHCRTNSTEDKYAWICRLASQIPDWIRTSFETTTTASEASAVGSGTPIMSLQTNPAFSQQSSGLPGSTFGLDMATMHNAEVLFSARGGRPSEPPLLSSPVEASDQSEPNRSFELLNQATLERLDSDNMNVDGNPQPCSDDFVRRGSQSLMPSDHDMIESWVRQLKHRMIGMSDADRNLLRERIYERLNECFAYHRESMNSNPGDASSAAANSHMRVADQGLDPTLHVPLVGHDDFFNRDNSLWEPNRSIGPDYSTSSQPTVGQSGASNLNAVALPRIQLSAPTQYQENRDPVMFADIPRNQPSENAGTSYIGMLDLQNSFRPGFFNLQPTESLDVHMGWGGTDWFSESDPYPPPENEDYSSFGDS